MPSLRSLALAALLLVAPPVLAEEAGPPQGSSELLQRFQIKEARQAVGVDADAFYAAGRETLIDQLSQDEWDAWDGRDEVALVSDPDEVDLTDDMVRDLAA